MMILLLLLYLLLLLLLLLGDGLVRLDYRTKHWDPWLQEYINTLSKKKPVVFTGDLNVAHLGM